MVRTFPIVFNQQDFWQHLGTGAQSIAQSGCYLCSFATLAKACGKDITPVLLNKQLITRQLYANYNEMVDDNLTKIFPDIVFQESFSYIDIPADIEKLRTLTSDPSTWVILEIDLGKGFTHFVLCAGVNGVVSVADPMAGSVIDFASKYGDPAKQILKFVVYKGTPVLADNSLIDDQLRAERDRNWNYFIETLSPLGLSANTQNPELTVSQVKDKLNAYQLELATSNAERDQYKKKYADEQKEVITLNDSLEKITKSNKDYGVESYEAQHSASQISEYLKAIEDAANISSNGKTDDKTIVDEVLKEISRLQKIEKNLPKTSFTTLPMTNGNGTGTVNVGMQQTKGGGLSIYRFLQNIGVLQK